MKHGDPQQDVPIDVWLGPDPDLALVEADMDAWAAAHGCRGYNGTCDCDADEDCDLAGTEQP